ncbi:DUF5129 domain-containing protein [Ornithinimicrobium flavum]|uniref:DUF5129 domain-containing protein n=1 Tax=Ornithinimicrobium flavum TaxID=1288636 RepID=UPI00106F762B|nr:DUF5129 domain-containing protein [Ornithinimicrobium flavum]
MSNLRRGLVGGLASLAVVGTSVGLFLAQAPEHAASEVVVDDTAEILHEPTLRAAVEDVRFHEPTTVALFTSRGGAAAATDDRALNDAVLAHARESRTEWLSADGQTWADDLYIYAVDPEGRLVGTYFGENRKVGQDSQLEIQDATKDDLRAGRWTEGAVVGVEAAAARMNAPFLRTTGGGVAAGAASLATLVASGAYLGVGLRRAGRSREARAEGDRRMAAVVRDAEVTELHARLIPDGTRYGGAMLRRYDDYARGVRELTELSNEARSIPERDYDTKESVARLTAYRDKARALDELDDVIAGTATLLNLDSAWPEVWERETAPLRRDLEAVEPLLGEELPDAARGTAESRALRSFASRELVRLDRMRAELEAGEVTPDDALDHLRATRDQLSSLLDDLAGVVARTFSEDEDEQRTLAEAMRTGRSGHPAEPTIVSTAHPAWTWYAVSSFRSGYSTGTSEVEQARSATSGSTSGYSGGGSFSGAGSSSRF